jgi:dTDP-4-dehydrorhamnose 3,5-epimerase
LAPHEEVKTVYCLSGAVWDVIVDLRPDSPTRFQWFAAELRALSGRGLYMPRGFAHGFLTLEPDSTVEYFIAPRYVPEASAGIRWNDERLSIAWPFKPAVISERDLSLPVVDGDG